MVRTYEQESDEYSSVLAPRLAIVSFVIICQRVPHFPSFYIIGQYVPKTIQQETQNNGWNHSPLSTTHTPNHCTCIPPLCL